jgi:hypothetical protein
MLAVGGHANAASALVYVANNGIDTAGCGAKPKPCRSITQAMAIAASGSTIAVGPGRYGDINRDGKFDAPGEERPQKREYAPPAGGPPVELSCVVCVLKPLHLLSTHGAESTVIDGGNAPYNVMQIVAQNVILGGLGRGFTIMHGAHADDGSGGDGVALLAGPARVIGNLATANASWGFDLVPGGEQLFRNPSNFLGGDVTASDNSSIANGGGFRLVSYAADVSLSNSTSVANTGLGLSVEGTGSHVVTKSRVSGNGLGIHVEGGPFQFTRNIVAGNDTFGFHFFDTLDLQNTVNSLTLNEIVGNTIGLSIERASAGVRANRNNIFGNGTDGSNCGITVSENSADARNDYWGAPTGPGPDPADHVGQEPLCDGTIPNNDAGLPGTVPFSRDPFAIN